MYGYYYGPVLNLGARGIECRRLAETYVFLVRRSGKRDVPVAAVMNLKGGQCVGD